MRRLIILLAILFIFLAVWSKIESRLENKLSNPLIKPSESVKVITEESVTIGVVKEVGPSVVTVSEQNTAQSSQFFGPFSILDIPTQSPSKQPEAVSIGSGLLLGQMAI